jgi:hypothetical protein
VERLERHVLAERQVAATMKAAGAKRVDVPAFDRLKARIDRELGADLTRRRVYDQETSELLAAIGLGR